MCEEEEIGGKNEKRRMMKEKMKYKKWLQHSRLSKKYLESGMDQQGTLLCEETWIDVMPISLPSDFINLMVFLDVS